jgi:hypothetical protein
VTAADVVPAIAPIADIAGGLNVPIQLLASFSAPGFPMNGVGSTYTAMVHWGDGTSSPATVSLTRRVARECRPRA